jgi:RimJ/RimL family protein N-acetyltransferase
VLSGCPEARFESYARAYAGCGPYTTKTYRRSYGRIYEALCCKNHLMNEKYNQLFRERPLDIIGRNVRLEALEMNRHLDGLHLVLSGVSAFENIAYDPHEVWGFLEDGPFENQEELSQSFVFNRKYNEAGFAIVHSVTNRTLGVILLTNDDPTNLSIQIEPPILSPNNNGTLLQLESCFLLMDRLFGYGYRRIQLSIDSQDAEKRKLCVRLGFSFEGILYKHMVVKDSSRDSSIYSMLNSDWKRGARTALFKTLYGVPAYQFDVSNEKLEEELEQQRIRKEQKRLEALEVEEMNSKKKL